MAEQTVNERSADLRSVVSEIFAEAIRAHERFITLDPSPVVAAADAIVEAIRRGGKVLTFGNGGSAADAQHLSAELVGRFLRERPAIPAIALSTDTSVMTSVGNDYGFDRIFARQVEALGRPGDVAVAISTSGRSPNVLAAVAVARERGLTVVALTGRDGGPLGASAHIHINVCEPLASRIQEVHRTIIHVVCELVERNLSEETGAPPGAGDDPA